MVRQIRFIIRALCVIIALGITLFAVVFGGAAWFNAPPEKAPLPEAEAMRFDESGALLLEVRNGETAHSVGDRLENSGVIKSRYFWHLLSRLDKEHIKAGTYRIELPASQVQIRSVLVAGEQILVKVTIPEGATLKKAAGILEAEGICGAEDFLSAAASREILDAYRVPGGTMEGYLYPDTYLFPPDFPAPRVVSVMADTFFGRLKDIAPETGTMTSAELNDRVIIASVVEREYRIPEEAALMAGVFYNRLKIGMALQSCATVEYIITEILERPHPEVLYNRDIEIKNPYNTYIRPGLPPGPISAPGETALRAAFSPAPSEYFYFRLVESDAGKHYFSRTLDDHIRAGALYVKGR